MGEKLLRADGTVEWRPGTGTVRQVKRQGATVITRGQLCTACLVGDWGLSTLKAAWTLCPDCVWLNAEVSRRAGVRTPSRAGRPLPGSGDQLLREDPSWEPVRAARRVRDAQLADVFARAPQAGVAVVDLTDRYGTYRAIDCADLAPSGLIAAGAEARVRRFAQWLRALAPEEYTVRAGAFADVAGLAAALREHLREARRSQARTELHRAVREVADGFARIGRAPRVVGSAVVGVVRAQRWEEA